MTGHKTLKMLVNYTQYDEGRLVNRLDTTEDSDKAERVQATSFKLKRVQPADDAEEKELPPNVVPFRPRR